MTDWEFKIDEKCKSLFKEYNDKGGLLIKPSDYILLKFKKGDEHAFEKTKYADEAKKRGLKVLFFY